MIVVADGQQFYVQQGAIKTLQGNTFGNEVNVVGIITRGTTPAFINATLDRHDEAVDYRTSMALASEYPAHELLIANDNHVFSALSGRRKRRNTGG